MWSEMITISIVIRVIVKRRIKEIMRMRTTSSIGPKYILLMIII